MGYHLKVFEHGDPKLWPLLGPFLCDRAVLKELEGPVYSAPGTTWIIAVENGRAIGFVSSRDGGDCWWHDYAYVIPERRRAGVFIALAAERERLEAKRGKRPVRIAVKETRWTHYEKRGFVVQSRRGSWIYGIREAA